MNRDNRIIARVIATCISAALLVGGLAACDTGNGGSASKAVNNDRKANTAILTQYQKSQPVPIYSWSQLRQNLIEFETAQVNATRTTTFFFGRDGRTTGPVMSCPSIGFPIPTTYQVTANELPGHVRDDGGQVPQLEPNGVYTGDTQGTAVVCIGTDSKPYFSYFEGDVMTVSGPAEWNSETNSVKMTGATTAKITVK